MTETDAMSPVDNARDAWLCVLEDLEAELGYMLVSASSTTGVSASPTTATGSTTGVSTGSTAGTSSTNEEWTPPSDLGPIPAELEGRARELLAGQRELIAELEHTKRATVAQLKALRKMPATRPTGASVYLDTHG
jgi:hypothetical protein